MTAILYGFESQSFGVKYNPKYAYCKKRLSNEYIIGYLGSIKNG